MLSDFGPEWEAGELSKFMIKIHDHISPKRVYLQSEKVVARPVEGDGAGRLECIFALALATVATLGRDIWGWSPSRHQSIYTFSPARLRFLSATRYKCLPSPAVRVLP